MPKPKIGDKVIVEGVDTAGHLVEGRVGKITNFTPRGTVKLDLRHGARQRMAEVGLHQVHKFRSKARKAG